VVIPKTLPNFGGISWVQPCKVVLRSILVPPATFDPKQDSTKDHRSGNLENRVNERILAQNKKKKCAGKNHITYKLARGSQAVWSSKTLYQIVAVGVMRPSQTLPAISLGIFRHKILSVSSQSAVGVPQAYKSLPRRSSELEPH
jgi:hypothetical protein